jgi:hypothetical protein
LTTTALVACPTEATWAADDKLRIQHDALLGVLRILAGDLAILLALGARLLQTEAGTDGPALLGDACAKAVGACEAVGTTRLPIRLRLVRGARCRRPAARFRDIARTVLGWPADLRRGRELARARATRAREWVAHRAGAQLACCRVAARRVDPHTGVAVLAGLDDTVAAHLQRERLLRRVRCPDARHVDVVAPHQRADVPDCAGREHLFAARRHGRHEEARVRVAGLRGGRAAVVREAAAICAVVLEDSLERTMGRE